MLLASSQQVSQLWLTLLSVKKLLGKLIKNGSYTIICFCTSNQVIYVVAKIVLISQFQRHDDKKTENSVHIDITQSWIHKQGEGNENKREVNNVIL